MTRVHAGDGSLLAEYARERRLYLPSAAIPPLVKEAFISAEDKNFYVHSGFDPEGILRAAYVFLQGSKHVQGASTITQQVAKNFLLNNERTLDRKIREILLSMRIELAYSKDKILELYLNEIYLGLSNYGIAAAALNYFDKSVHELTIAEVAYLAALPKEPSALNPFRNHDRAIERRNYVIGRMAEDGYITAERGAEGARPNRSSSSRGCRPPIRSPPAFSPRKCAANCPTATASRSSTRAACPSAPRSIRRLQLMARKALVDGLVRYDEAHGWHGDGQVDRPRPGLGRRARRHPPARRRQAVAPRGGARRRRRLGAHRPAARARPVRRGRPRSRNRLDHPRRRQMDRQEDARRREAGRRRLCRADRREGRRISPAPDSGSFGRLRRDGPVHRPRLRDGRRLLLRPVGIQPGDAGAAPAGLLVQADRLRGGDRQRLYALVDRARRADRDRHGQRQDLAAGEFRGQVRRPAYAALRRRALDQPDDGAPGARHRHAADRRIRQALRRLRQPAALSGDVAGRRRDHGAAHGHRLFDVRQWRQAHQGDADRPHPGPLGPHDLQARRAHLPGLRRGASGTTRRSPS